MREDMHRKAYILQIHVEGAGIGLHAADTRYYYCHSRNFKVAQQTSTITNTE